MGKSARPSEQKRPGGRHGRPPIASVSVTLPQEAADQIKQVSEERSADQGSWITQIDINAEIVGALLKDIKAKEPLIFYPAGRRDKSIRHVRKTIWLPAATLKTVKRYAKGFGLPDSTFILTAILRWFEKQGTTFPGFFETAKALNILRLTSLEQKMPEPAPIRRRKDTLK